MSEHKSRYELFLEEDARKAQPTKRCSKCKEIKALSEYYKDPRRPAGIKSQCKKCHYGPRKYRDADDRFWKTFWLSVERIGDCLIWTGICSTTGYPKCHYKGNKDALVRRIVYRLACGELPDDAFVITRCNNRRCVRHSHLQRATKEEIDLRRRNHLPVGEAHPSRVHPENVRRGEQHHKAKITEDDVRIIRRMYDTDGVPTNKIAEMFGLHHSTAWKIACRKSWKHVDA